MTLYEMIKKELKGFGKPNSYFRDWLFSKVSGHYTLEPKVGQLLFFSYSAKNSTKLKYWDKYPLIMVNETGEFDFSGGNLHYMFPGLRKSIGRTFQNGSVDYPTKMHHKYLKANVNSPLFIIDEVEWADIGLIPVEDFVKIVKGKQVNIRSSVVWNDS